MAEAIFDAIILGRPLMALAELDKGTSIEVRNRDGETPLVVAASYGNVELVKHLLERGADVKARGRKGWTALHCAAHVHNSELADLLLSRGAELDAPDAFGNTPLWRAVFDYRNTGDFIPWLLGQGANPDRANHTGISARMLAHKIANYNARQYFPV